MLNTFIDIKPHHLNLQSRFLLGETFFESKTRKKKDKIPNAKIKGLKRVKVYTSCNTSMISLQRNTHHSMDHSRMRECLVTSRLAARNSEAC